MIPTIYLYHTHFLFGLFICSLPKIVCALFFFFGIYFTRIVWFSIWTARTATCCHDVITTAHATLCSVEPLWMQNWSNDAISTSVAEEKLIHPLVVVRSMLFCLAVIVIVLGWFRVYRTATKKTHTQAAYNVYWTWQTNITHGLIYSSYKTLIFLLCAIIVFILKNGCIQWFMFYFRSFLHLFFLLFCLFDSKLTKAKKKTTQRGHIGLASFSSSSDNDEELLRNIVIFYPLGQ